MVINNIVLQTGLKIGGIASPNANHFWNNCESLWQSESPNCESLLAYCESAKDPFLVLTPFLHKTFSFLDNFMYMNIMQKKRIR